MWKTLSAILLAVPLFAQLDSGSVTVTATRAIVVQPDQAVFSVSVAAPIDSTEDDVLGIVAPIGLTAANLTGISGDAANLTYNFTWTVPITKVKETASALQSLSIRFQVSGTRVSDELLAPARCPMSDLMADAVDQARKLATAAGTSVGPVLAVSNAGGSASPGVPVAGFLGGAFSFVGAYTPVFLSASTTLNCSLMVKFQLKQ